MRTITTYIVWMRHSKRINYMAIGHAFDNYRIMIYQCPPNYTVSHNSFRLTKLIPLPSSFPQT